MTAKHLLDQIVRGLDGVTAGPWVVKETTVNGIGYGGHWLEVADENQDICISGSGGAKSYTQRVVDTQQHDDNEANLRHFARCDPDAIREIAAYVRDLEERLAKAAEALEPFNQAALAIRTAERMNRREFQDGDTFVSGVAWKEDDKVRTITFGDFRRSRTALSQIRSEK